MDSRERFNAFLTNSGISQKDLAKNIGFSRQVVNSIANGKGRLTEKFAFQLQEKYKVNANWLLTGEGEMFIQSSQPDVTKSNPCLELEGRVIMLEQANQQLRNETQQLVKELHSLSKELSDARKIISLYDRLNNVGNNVENGKEKGKFPDISLSVENGEKSLKINGFSEGKEEKGLSLC